jgi:hypothetical protein
MIRYAIFLIICLLAGNSIFAQDSAAAKLNQGLKDLGNKMEEIQKHYYEREMLEIKDSYSVGLNNVNLYITDTIQQIIDLGLNQEKSVNLLVNLAEICLLSNDQKNFRKYEQIIKNNENEFQDSRPTTTAYLKTYYSFLKQDHLEFKREINNFISNATFLFAVERPGSSQMDEFYTELLSNSLPHKAVMMAFVDYLRGAKKEEDLALLVTQI